MNEDTPQGEVLTPSTASIALGAIGLVLSTLFIVFPKLGGDAVLGLLFGHDDSLTLINFSKENYGPVVDQLLSNDLLGRAVVFGLWMFVGLWAFIFLMSLSGIFKTIQEQKRELTYVHQNKELLVRNDLKALGLRLLVAAVWAGFTVFCIRYVLSYFAITGVVAFGGGQLMDWGIFVLAAIALSLALHIHVIFARLISGKTRLWNT